MKTSLLVAGFAVLTLGIADLASAQGGFNFGITGPRGNTLGFNFGSPSGQPQVGPARAPLNFPAGGGFRPAGGFQPIGWQPTQPARPVRPAGFQPGFGPNVYPVGPAIGPQTRTKYVPETRLDAYGRQHEVLVPVTVAANQPAPAGPTGPQFFQGGNGNYGGSTSSWGVTAGFGGMAP